MKENFHKIHAFQPQTTNAKREAINSKTHKKMKCFQTTNIGFYKYQFNVT